MNKNEVLAILSRYLQTVKSNFPLKKLIYLKSYSSEADSVIEVAVVVEHMDMDYIEARDKLIELAGHIDSRIDPLLIESDKPASNQYYDEILEKGDIIYSEPRKNAN